MKHRSTVVFIIILAALIVAPQAAQQVEQLAANTASRVEGAIWNAFLSVKGRKGTSTGDGALLVAASQPRQGNEGPHGRTSHAATARVNSAPARVRQSHAGAAVEAETPATHEGEALALVAKNSFKPFVLDFHTQGAPLPQVSPAPLAPGAEVIGVRLGEKDKAMLRVVARLHADENNQVALARLAQAVERQARAGNVRAEALRRAGVEWTVEVQDERNAPAPPAKGVKVRTQATRSCPPAPAEVPPPASFVYHGAIGIDDSF